jgi:hypothetical protein
LVGEGGEVVLRAEPVQLRTSGTELLIQGLASGVRHLAGGVIRLELAIHEGVECVLLVEVSCRM